MGQVFVACKNCGVRFSTRMFVERETFNAGKIEPSRYRCPECESEADYAVNDYEYSD